MGPHQRVFLYLLSIAGLLQALAGCAAVPMEDGGRRVGLDLEASRDALKLAIEELSLAAVAVDDPDTACTLKKAAASAEVVLVAIEEHLEAGSDEVLSLSVAASGALKTMPKVAEVFIDPGPDPSPEDIERVERRQTRLRLALGALRTALALVEVSG